MTKPAVISGMRATIIYEYKVDGEPRMHKQTMVAHNIQTRLKHPAMYPGQANVWETVITGNYMDPPVPSMADPLIFGASTRP